MTGGADTSSKKPKMSDTERSALMAKMDADLEEHFAELERKAAERGPRGKDPDGWTEENWEEEMQKHPFFNQVMSYLYVLSFQTVMTLNEGLERGRGTAPLDARPPRSEILAG